MTPPEAHIRACARDEMTGLARRVEAIEKALTDLNLVVWNPAPEQQASFEHVARQHINNAHQTTPGRMTFTTLTTKD